MSLSHPQTSPWVLLPCAIRGAVTGVPVPGPGAAPPAEDEGSWHLCLTETSFPRNLSHLPSFLSTRPRLFVNSLWVPGAPRPRPRWGGRRQAQWLLLCEVEVTGADRPRQGAPSTSAVSGISRNCGELR